jgi:hypothetical protein
MSKITDYLIKLGEDKDALAAHNDDPQGHMAEHGLSDEEQEIVISGDHERILDHVREHAPENEEEIHIVLRSMAGMEGPS